MRIILDILMGNDYTQGSEEEFEFDDMSLSAACEVMNQMMGSSATALSEILGMTVNISTPESKLITSRTDVIESFESDGHSEENVVAVSFNLNIEDDSADDYWSSHVGTYDATDVTKSTAYNGNGDAIERKNVRGIIAVRKRDGDTKTATATIDEMNVEEMDGGENGEALWVE